MRKVLIVVGFLGLLFAVLTQAGCGGGGSASGNSPATTITGVVSDKSGLPIGGATIAAGSATALSKLDGTYSLAVTPATTLKVSATKAGLIETFDVISIASGQTVPVNFMLVVVGKSNSLTAMDTTPTAATNADGVTIVTMPAGSIVDSSGVPVVTAAVDVTAGKPLDANYTESFPGVFIGTQGGAEKAIESFGYVTIDITSGGKKCNVAAGKTADIAIPVDTLADPGTPQIELWSLDQASGKWLYEGMATRDSSASPVVYRASVTHFSTYNLDRPIQAKAPLAVTVKNGTTPVAGAVVVVQSTSASGGKWEGRGVTGGDGICSFTEIPQGSVNVVATYGALKGVGYKYDVTGGTIVMDISLVEMTSKEVLFYRMVNGTKTPVGGARVMVMVSGAQGTQGGETSLYTGNDGRATLQIATGSTIYISAYATIDSVNYGFNDNYPGAGNVPAEIELK